MDSDRRHSRIANSCQHGDYGTALNRHDWGGKEGENAFFIAISNFKRENGQLSTTDKLNCHARRASDKGGFLMYKGTMESTQGNARGDVMAFYTDMNTETDTQDAKKAEVPDMPLSRNYCRTK